jgi:HK97 family phage prohead protease
VVRGRNLICSIAALPLHELDSARVSVDSPFLRQIDPNVPNVVTLAQTIDDLIFEGVSWWRVIEYAYDGRPKWVHHVDVEAVSIHPPAGHSIQSLPSGLYPQGVVWVNGETVDRRHMIRFDSPNPPLRDSGPAIRRAVKLAQAGEMYADDPEARAFWTPDGGVDPGDEDEIKGYLKDYAAARRDGSEAYIPAALKRNLPSGTNPVDLQLAQLQQRSDLEIANLMSLDPEDLGVNTTSRTYANAVDRRVDKVNENLGMWMRAITDRLSMDDITKRGTTVAFDLAAYMQADPATRWSTYGTAIDKGIMSVEEVRAAENLPDIPIEPPARALPAPAVTQEPVMQTRTGTTVALAGEHETVTVAFSSEDFAASKEKRTVGGMVLPFNVRTDDHRKLRFAPGSVTWNKAAVSRVKLDREHDLGQLLGSATEIKSDAAGLRGKFRVARTAAGDEALALAEDGALDGLSAVVEILAADPDDGGGLYVTSAHLRRVTLTADPAFSGARVDTVAASAVRTPEGSTTVTDTATTAAPAAVPGTEALTAALTGATDAFTRAVEALNSTVPAEQRASGLSPVAAVTEPLVYNLTGLGHSFVRDAWDARNLSYGSKEANDAYARLQKYTQQTEELATAAAVRRVELANAGNTTDQAQLIPAQYRGDLYVGQVPQGRPIFDAIGTRVTLANATPFKVPVWVGAAGLSGENVEGTGLAAGTITDHTYRTCTPTARQGEFVVTRELMDSSNPAIDVIAMNAMHEEYRQDTEAILSAELAAATDNNTGAGQSTEGCYVYTVTGTGNDLAIDGIREMEADYPGHRFLVPDRMLASPTGYKGLVKAVDDIGRPLFPFVAPQNALGSVGRAAATLAVDGLACPNAWSLTDATDDVALFNSVDWLVGESALLTFKFFEKGGPENIYLNIWGYFVSQMLRYTGFHAVAYTAA